MWQKINDKQYRIELEGTLTDIFVPYGKAEKLFATFVGSGGIIDNSGNVTNDILSLVSNFSAIGDIILTTYGPKGSIVSEGDCSTLSVPETIELFKVGVDIVENFIETIAKSRTAVEKEKTGE